MDNTSIKPVGVGVSTPVVDTASSNAQKSQSSTTAADNKPAGENLDAVAVSLTTQYLGLTKPEPKTNDSKAKPVITKDEAAASAAAETLRKLAEQTSSTKVEFDVQNLRDGKHLLSFKVVDQKTGAVVREFPPEEFSKKLIDAHSGLDEKKTSVLLDSLI